MWIVDDKYLNALKPSCCIHKFWFAEEAEYSTKNELIFKIPEYIYSVTHKWCDCKDDLKLWIWLFQATVKWSLLPWIYSFMAFLLIEQRKKQSFSCMNHEYKETDSIYSLQSSLKYQPLWITLYIGSMPQYISIRRHCVFIKLYHVKWNTLYLIRW